MAKIDLPSLRRHVDTSFHFRGWCNLHDDNRKWRNFYILFTHQQMQFY